MRDAFGGFYEIDGFVKVSVVGVRKVVRDG